MPLVEGSNGISLTCKDALGNESPATTGTIVLDTGAPSAPTLNPVTSPTGTTPQTISGTKEANSSVWLNGSEIVALNANTTWSYDMPLVEGSNAISLTSKDSVGNESTATTSAIELNTIPADTTPPVITLVGANPLLIEFGTTYIDPGATATDDVDGDLTGFIVVGGDTVNPSVLGSYIITYDVSDSAGNAAAQVTRTVDVVDTTKPVIVLTGANPQVIPVGDAYTELGATATDNVDGDISGSIVIDASGVNTDAVGSYIVTYNVVDSSGNAATPVTRTVTVTATTVSVSFQDGVDGYAGTRDTKLISQDPNTNFGDATTLELDGSPLKSSLLYWDLASIPAGSVVQSVDVTVNISNASGHVYEFYELLRPWVESDATWNEYASGQSWQVAGADDSLDRGSTVLGSISGAKGLATISLNAAGVAMVQAWVDNPSSNHGFIILNYINAKNGLDFSSRENGTASKHPKLTVTYSAGSP